MADSKRNLETRFWSKVHKTDQCWNWTGTLSVSGYGVLQVGQRQVKAHRLSYEMAVGLIPPGLVIDHLCRNKKCVRPDHLEPVENAENVMRGEGWAPKRARWTHCAHGHELSGKNLYIRKNGRRSCRACGNRLTGAYHKKKRIERGPVPLLPVGPKTCPICGREFQEFRQWIGHMKAHR